MFTQDANGVLYAKNPDGNRIFGWGTTVPADASVGWEKGAIFFDTDVASGTPGIYVNDGDAASSLFKVLNTGTTSLAELAAGITPSHIVKFAGLSESETDADASVVIAVPGVVAGDIVLATIKAQAGTASILKAVPTTDTITVTLSGNGGAGTIVQYAVLRAAA